MDPDGNFYIADTWNQRVRLVDTSGRIHTVAGNGSRGYSGDGGDATSAKLDTPRGIALDSFGNFYIGDYSNGCVRFVLPGGTITTLFGYGLGLDHAKAIALDLSGNLLIADTENHRIRLLQPSGAVETIVGTGTAGYSGDDGLAIGAKLDKPNGIAVDPLGNIYIADTDNHCIRKVDTSGIITTVAGIGRSNGYSGDGGDATLAKLDKPRGVFVKPVGESSNVDIFIADSNNECIRRINPSGNIRTVAGIGKSGGYSGDGGAATEAKLRKPRGIFIDTSGSMYIADRDNHCIRKVEGGIIDTIAGTGSSGSSGDGGLATNAKLNHPTRVFVDTSGNLFIADMDNHRIRVVSHYDQVINAIAGTGSDGFNGNDQPAILAKLHKPFSVAMASTRGGRKIFISDKDNDRIRVLKYKIVRELY